MAFVANLKITPKRGVPQIRKHMRINKFRIAEVSSEVSRNFENRSVRPAGLPYIVVVPFLLKDTVSANRSIFSLSVLEEKKHEL